MATKVSAINWIYVIKLRTETHLYHSSVDDEMIIDAIAKETDFVKDEIELIKVATHTEYKEC